MQLQYSPEPIRAVAFECLVTNPLILCTIFLGMCCHLVATLGSAWESGPQAMWSPSEVTDREDQLCCLPPAWMPQHLTSLLCWHMGRSVLAMA